MIHNDSSTPADTSQATTVNLLSTKEAAELLGVTVNTLRQWRNRKLFGCRFFTPDATYGTACYYYRERVEQLKAVYQPNVLQDMYKLARLNSEDNTPDDFQKSVSLLGNAGKLAQSTNAPACHGNLLTTKEAADIIGAEPATLRKWRERKLFGCPFFLLTNYTGRNGITTVSVSNSLPLSTTKAFWLISLSCRRTPPTLFCVTGNLLIQASSQGEILP